jgi:hypothetical protein
VTASGGCQCGAIRYRFVGRMEEAIICHCRMCQKAFGGWGAALVTLPATHLDWTRGTPALFRSSASVARGFCRDCGTPLFMREDGEPAYEMAVGTLDDPNAVPPFTRQSGVESKCVWFDDLAGLPAERTEDYRSEEDLHKLASLQHPDHDTEVWPAPGRD